MISVRIYSRRECHLCDVAKDTIERLASEFRLPLAIEVIDIDTDPVLHDLYTNEVPVIFVDGRKAFKYRVDERAFLARVDRATRKQHE